MARRRMVDPGFWQSENMAKLTIRQRLLFIGLFSNADDEGRLGGKPALIRSIVFPYEDISIKDIEEDLKNIEATGSIFRYSVKGNSYIQVTGWEKYQRVDKPKPSNIPPPSENDSKIDSKIDSCLKEKKGKEINNNGQSASNDTGFDVDFDAEFEVWWQEYPRKRGKTAAVKHWCGLRKKGVSVEQLTAARDRYKTETKGKSMDYIMHGSTFLGPGDRWKDYLQEQEPLKDKPKQLEIDPQVLAKYSNPPRKVDSHDRDPPKH